MSIGLHGARKRRSQKIRMTFLKWFFALLVISVAGLFAYLSGQDLAQRQLARLEEKVEGQELDIARLQRLRGTLNSELAEANRKAQEWQERYNRDVPRGSMKDLMDQINSKLESGVSFKRIGFLLSTARKEQHCDNSPETKRFFVNTPFFNGANDSVSYGHGNVTITAVGQSARGPGDKAESWYDPGQPVKLIFTLLGGRAVVKEGKLPLHKSVVVAGHEYRFTVVAGSHGFVNITGDRCDYP